jgi:hypothetical protein
LEEKIDAAHLEGVGGVVEFSELSMSMSWAGFKERGLTLVYSGKILNEESTKLVPHTYPIATLLVNYQGLQNPKAHQYQKRPISFFGGWWLVAGGWWLVAGSWWLVAGHGPLLA